MQGEGFDSEMIEFSFGKELLFNGVERRKRKSFVLLDVRYIYVKKNILFVQVLWRLTKKIRRL